MKRLIMLAIFFIAIGGVSAATTVDMNWGGFANIDTTFNSSDDAVVQVWANGNTGGNFHAADSDNNPYNYGVDNTNAWLRGDVTMGGGNLQLTYTRTDAKESMYGAAGQISNSFVGSSGIGALNFRVGSNYASLGSSNYGWQSNAQFSATGDSFNMWHTLDAGTNSGFVRVIGDGSAVINHMSDYAAGDNFNFGAGAGCYTNADIEATGSGYAEVSGQADSYLKANDLSWTMPVGGLHTESWTYTDGLSVTNYAFNGN